MWNSRHWRSSMKNKSIFGGTVKPHEEVRALQKDIKAQEAHEFAEFEKRFDNQLSSVWDESSKSVQENVPEPVVTEPSRPPLTSQEKLMILSQLQLNLKKILNAQNTLIHP